LATASAEYVHWLNNTWGVAGFVDVGDAADRFTDLHMNQGIGLGLRYKTPAGPIAVDVAYGRQAHKVRVDFFLGIAF
jgi:translocation and assembly module TamA